MLGLLRTKEELKNLQMLLKQLRCLWSFGKRRDAQVMRTLQQQLKVVQQEELDQLEEHVVRALKSLAVRALKSLAVRAFLRNWAFELASWA